MSIQSFIQSRVDVVKTGIMTIVSEVKNIGMNMKNIAKAMLDMVLGLTGMSLIVLITVACVSGFFGYKVVDKIEDGISGAVHCIFHGESK